MNHLRYARLHVERSCVAVVVVVQLHPLFAVISQRSIISCCFATSGESDSVVVVESIVCQQLKPVGVHRFGTLYFSQETLVIYLSSDKAVISSFISHHRHIVGESVVEIHQLLTKLHTLLRVHQIDVAVRIARTCRIFQLTVVGDARRSWFPLFSGHHNHTICRTSAVESRCSSIFQHIDALNVLRVDARNRITNVVDVVGVIELVVGHVHRIGEGDAIEHPQRFAVADEGRRTTDAHTRRCTHFTRVLHKHHVRHTTFECLFQTCHTRHQDFFHLQRRDGTCLLTSGNRAIARHHGFTKTLAVIIEHKVVVRHVVFATFGLSLHTNVRSRDGEIAFVGASRQFQPISTLVVSLRCPNFAPQCHSHISPNEGFSLFVKHHTRHHVVFRGGL